MVLFGPNGEILSPQQVNDLHRNDDVDDSSFAHHHTLGIKPNQAAPGNHQHLHGLRVEGGLTVAGGLTTDTLDVTGCVSAVGYVPTAETTASTAYTDLTTPGPIVTSICPPSGMFLVAIDFWASHTSVGNRMTAGVKIENRATPGSGGWSLVSNPADQYAADYIADTAGVVSQSGKTRVIAGTPGYEYQFTLQYKTGAATATFKDRLLSVVPLVG